MNVPKGQQDLESYKNDIGLRGREYHLIRRTLLKIPENFIDVIDTLPLVVVSTIHVSTRCR